MSRVSAVVPMRRELKAQPSPLRGSWPTVSAVVPMRRELKDDLEQAWGISAAWVSAVVPMRRELKESLNPQKLSSDLRFSSCPDEEGTERAQSLARQNNYHDSFSSCPDEEGTERGQKAGRVPRSP